MSQATKIMEIQEGLTYDDVLLVPSYADILPTEEDIDLTTNLTKNISLKTPVISAAMDTVTGSAMAIAMAQEGGIGVIHKNMSIQQQADEVRKVKRAENGMILDPITVQADSSVADALELMSEYKIGGIPVITGFQGVNKNFRLSTIGRSGSDATAIMFAKFVKANECIIYTDVDGVYTTDPRDHKKAKKIKKIHYDEMLEMASLG